MTTMFAHSLGDWRHVRSERSPPKRGWFGGASSCRNAPSESTGRWRREVAPVVDDAHHATPVDIDAGKWKVDGWFGLSLSGPAIDHARQVRDTHPVWSYVRLASVHT